MSDNVVPLFGRSAPTAVETVEERRVAWVSGEWICLRCKHKWAMVMEVPMAELERCGVVKVECPKCEVIQGVPRFEFYPTERQQGPELGIRVCNCGCDLFLLTREGHLCPVCGAFQRY